MEMATSKQKQDDKSDLLDEVSQSHECRLKELYLKNASQEITKLEKDLEKLRLEKKWCFNDRGERIIPTPEDQAERICKHIMNDDDLTKDVVKALRMKKLDLQINIRKLKEMCDTLSEEKK